MQKVVHGRALASVFAIGLRAAIVHLVKAQRERAPINEISRPIAQDTEPLARSWHRCQIEDAPQDPREYA